MPQITIPIHSFVDLITNSSTEIYVNATEGTLTSIKALVNNILKLSGGLHMADDLFTFELRPCHRWGSEIYTQEEIDEERAEREESDMTDLEASQYHAVVVKAKDVTDETAQLVASTLSNLTNLFDIDAEYN